MLIVTKTNSSAKKPYWCCKYHSSNEKDLNNKMKIRIVDIAKKAGVSVGTVDRKLHDRGRVSSKAAEKIEKAINELGYKPDMLARNLALKTNQKIVCLIPDPKDTQFWQQPIEGILRAKEELTSFKLDVEIITYEPNRKSFETAYKTALRADPRGVIYVPMFKRESEAFANILHKAQIPFVHINIQHQQVNPLCFIGQNTTCAGKTAAHICELALTKANKILIASIKKEQQEYAHDHGRIDGFIGYFKEKGISKEQIVQLSLNHKNHNEKLIQTLNDDPKIEIIYVPNSRTFKIAGTLKQHQINNKIVVGFDTLDVNIELLEQGYITYLIGQQSQNQGYLGVIALFNKIFKGEQNKQSHLLPIDLLNKENISYYI